MINQLQEKRLQNPYKAFTKIFIILLSSSLFALQGAQLRVMLKKNGNDSSANFHEMGVRDARANSGRTHACVRACASCMRAYSGARKLEPTRPLLHKSLVSLNSQRTSN